MIQSPVKQISLVYLENQKWNTWLSKSEYPHTINIIFVNMIFIVKII